MKTRTGRIWTYVRDDRPFGGDAPPAAVFFYSPDRASVHPERYLAAYCGILQADAYAGFNKLYEPDRKPRPITEAGCWAHASRKLLELADLAAKARNRNPTTISPIAFEAVQRVRRHLHAGTFDRRPVARSARSHAPQRRRTAGERSRRLDETRAEQALASQRRRQGLRLHAQAHRCLHTLPRRWPHLPEQQCGRARVARDCARSEVVAVRRLRSRRRARRGHADADSNGQLVDVNPQAWLADVLARIAEHKITDLVALLPWNWRCAAPAARAA